MDSYNQQAIDPKVIKELRTKLNLNQADMAKLIGCNRSELSLIENGKALPDWFERFINLSRAMSQAGFSWEDAILKMPDFPPRAAEDGGDYNV
jgi:DNA-binding XRE family transcriptional regulator